MVCFAAGGLAVLLTVDHVREKVPNFVYMRAIADCKSSIFVCDLASLLV